MTKLDRFTLLTGSVGLIGDTITILTFVGAGLIFPNLTGFENTPSGVLLFTGLVGLYSLTMLIWFMLRRKQLNPTASQLGFDELQVRTYDARRYLSDEPIIRTKDSALELVLNLVPFFGAFPHILNHKSARVIFWIAVFISLFPTVFWLYLLTANALTAGILGGALSFLLAQYSTFFALALDKFQRSVYTDFSQ
mgnify:CR=1 FL=1